MQASTVINIEQELQNPAFEKACNAIESVRKALADGFSTEAARKECFNSLSRAYTEVRWVINGACMRIVDRNIQQEYAEYWDLSLPSDLHNVRAKHFDYVLKLIPSAGPLFEAVRNLFALRAEVKAYTLAPKKTPKKDRVPVDGDAFKMVGICPCCGQEYAVHAKTGGMSKHGYKVSKQWSIFTGVCSGELRAPIERERAVADQVVAAHKQRVAELLQQAIDMASGKTSPEFINKGSSSKPVLVPFAECNEREQRIERERMVRDFEYSAREHERFSAFLAAQIDKFHGQPLRKVLL